MCRCWPTGSNRGTRRCCSRRRSRCWISWRGLSTALTTGMDCCDSSVVLPVSFCRSIAPSLSAELSGAPHRRAGSGLLAFVSLSMLLCKVEWCAVRFMETALSVWACAGLKVIGVSAWRSGITEWMARPMWECARTPGRRFQQQWMASFCFCSPPRLAAWASTSQAPTGVHLLSRSTACMDISLCCQQWCALLRFTTDT